LKENVEPKAKVLIVDDDETNLKYLHFRLTKVGYDVSKAISGEEAISLLEEILPDIILLDIRMPDPDGFAVCEMIKKEERTRDIPIIFLTALTDTVDKIKGFQLGGVDYITKPINFEELNARVAAHLSLAKQHRELREANISKDKFLSILAHDLKSPFTGLIGLSELLFHQSGELEPEEVKEFATGIYEVVRTIYSLIDNLLMWTRLRLGKIQNNPIQLDLRNMVTAAFNSFETNSLKKGLSVENGVPEKMMVKADVVILDLTLKNLISNAVKFTPYGGFIKANADIKDDKVYISITDNGIGMSEANIQKLFRLDTIVTTSGTNNEQGSGLGLLLVKNFVEMMGGTVQLESEQGKGTTVTFSIKLV